MSFKTQVAASVTAALIITGLHLQAVGPTVAVPAASNARVVCGNYAGTVLTRQGDTGARVREVQCLLAFRGWFGGAVDGRYGRSTYLAVRAYQSWSATRGCAVRLEADGIVGLRTWSGLHSSDGCPTV